MVDILSMLPEEIEALVLSLGEKKYRADQIFSELYRLDKLDRYSAQKAGFKDFTLLPRPLIEQLYKSAHIKTAQVEKKLVSSDGTVKLLLKLDDGELIECVFMTYKHGNTVCVSTQAGCRMGCAFCASAKGGLHRNLTPSEMLLQLLICSRETGKRVDGIVLMGTGEPLDNYDNVLKFLRLANHKKGLNIGMRHISLSTCGLVDKILALAKEKLQLTLSISLHAATDAARKSIMPIANKYSLAQLMAACDTYTKATGRRISYEYVLIEGKNDSESDADALGELLCGRLCHLNLIPLNPVSTPPSGKFFKKSEKNSIKLFTERLKTYKINATIRRTLGDDINAACGQLRNG